MFTDFKDFLNKLVDEKVKEINKTKQILVAIPPHTVLDAFYLKVDA